jgi:hypothetical protein
MGGTELCMLFPRKFERENLIVSLCRHLSNGPTNKLQCSMMFMLRHNLPPQLGGMNQNTTKCSAYQCWAISDGSHQYE